MCIGTLGVRSTENLVWSEMFFLWHTCLCLKKVKKSVLNFFSYHSDLHMWLFLPPPSRPLHGPLFYLDLVLDQQGVHYSTELDNFQTALVTIFDRGVHATHSVPQIEKVCYNVSGSQLCYNTHTHTVHCRQAVLARNPSPGVSRSP